MYESLTLTFIIGLREETKSIRLALCFSMNNIEEVAELDEIKKECQKHIAIVIIY